jgi:DNA-binding LacI/PurR family transcriptional regulator
VLPGEFTEHHGVETAERLIAAGDLPSAVFAGNDLIAVGMLSSFAAHGVRVPEDVSVVGYDNIYLAGMRHIDLTTIHQPRLEMGRLALEALVERINHTRSHPVVHRLKPTLVVRSTTAPPT